MMPKHCCLNMHRIHPSAQIPQSRLFKILTTSMGHFPYTFWMSGRLTAFFFCAMDNAMLIDGGNQADADFVTSYLLLQGVTDLEYVVCTHAHEDHVGGLPSVLNAFSVQHVLCSVENYDSQIFTRFCDAVKAQNLSLEVPSDGDTFNLGQAQVTVLGPIQTYPDTNNMSLVLRIEYGQTSFLFMGDAESDAEKTTCLTAMQTCQQHC